MIERRFTVLLGAMLVYLLAVPALQRMALDDGAIWPNALATGLLAVMLLSAVFSVAGHRATRIVAIILAVPALLFRLLHTMSPGSVSEMIPFVLAILVLALIAAVILRTLFRPMRVTGETIAASLCVYVLLVLIWAFAYALVNILQPGSFAYSLADQLGPDTDLANSVLPVYFSLVTITTLGYGDIVPASPVAQMLASMEALVGQMYIAILVARLVALHIAGADGDEKP